MIRILLALVALAIAAPEPAVAQAPTPSTTWYRARFHQFKPGQASEGKKIIHEHFFPVERAIGRAIIAFDAETGDWDHIVFFPLSAGVTSLDPKVQQAEGDRWMAALVKQEGTTEKAQALLKRFDDMTARTEDQLVQRAF